MAECSVSVIRFSLRMIEYKIHILSFLGLACVVVASVGSLQVYGKRVITRSCFYEDLDDPADKCAQDNTSSYIKTLYCHTCTTDGCNGAAGFAPYAALLALLPALLLKFFK